jgi:A/G-specific adenine glycosylase
MSNSGDDPVNRWYNRVQTLEFHQKSIHFQTLLLEWFAKFGRDLPWRKTHDPYQILVSELMLQQTQVDRVLEYWPRFLARFPDFRSVAKATEAEVIQLWEGLGYYNRARNLRYLAIEIQNKYGGRFPEKKEEILALPGIGDYTRGAIMSFALNKWAPIVDTNVNRVYSRMFLFLEKKIGDREKEKILWLLADYLTPKTQFWEYNQGIMDFGSIQCLGDKPLCGRCPMQKDCKYYQHSSLRRFFM